MHEWSLVQSLLERIEGAAHERGAVRVTRIDLRVGELDGVDPDLFAKAFELFRESTLCATARLSVTRVAPKWQCPSCGVFLETGATLVCSTCDTAAVLQDGGDVLLDKIELEVP